MPDVKEKCPVLMRIINLGSALVLIGFGIAGIIVMSAQISANKVFLIFSPILMIIVGLLFVTAEFQIECIMKHFSFLKSYFGRGIFNLFMASAVFYYFACGTNDNIAVAWISAILIFVLGIFYIIIGLFCFSFGDKKESKEELVT